MEIDTEKWLFGYQIYEGNGSIYSVSKNNKLYIGLKLSKKNLEFEIYKFLEKSNNKNLVQVELIKEPNYVILEKLNHNFDSVEHIIRMDAGFRQTFIDGICSALHFLHKHKIVHNDLRKNNIMFDDNLNVKLIDFGLSRKIRPYKEIEINEYNKIVTPFVNFINQNLIVCNCAVNCNCYLTFFEEHKIIMNKIYKEYEKKLDNYYGYRETNSLEQYFGFLVKTTDLHSLIFLILTIFGYSDFWYTSSAKASSKSFFNKIIFILLYKNGKFTNLLKPDNNIENYNTYIKNFNIEDLEYQSQKEINYEF